MHFQDHRKDHSQINRKEYISIIFFLLRDSEKMSSQHLFLKYYLIIRTNIIYSNEPFFLIISSQILKRFHINISTSLEIERFFSLLDLGNTIPIDCILATMNNILWHESNELNKIILLYRPDLAEYFRYEKILIKDNLYYK